MSPDRTIGWARALGRSLQALALGVGLLLAVVWLLHAGSVPFRYQGF